jgi:hypothetical protein
MIILVGWRAPAHLPEYSAAFPLPGLGTIFAASEPTVRPNPMPGGREQSGRVVSMFFSVGPKLGMSLVNTTSCDFPAAPGSNSLWSGSAKEGL